MARDTGQTAFVTIASRVPTQRKGEIVTGGVLAWLTSTRATESCDVRQALLLTLPETLPLMAMAFFWTQAVAIIALWATGAPWAAAWIAADIALLALRLDLRRRHAAACRAQRPRPSARMLLANAAWFGTIALGSMACVLTGDLRLTLLGTFLSAGFAGYIASRCAAFPRFALITLCVMSGGLAAGLFGSPLPSLNALGLLVLAAPPAYYTLVLLNHDILVVALRSQQESLRLSRSDPLTGLANRIVLREHLAGLCRDRSSAPARGFAVLCLDLDGFKLVNDRYGHAGGDCLLRSVAAHLLDAVRGRDAVCRVGGDEFVILLADAGREDAIGVAVRLIAGVAKPHDLGHAATARVGLSIGIALAPEHDDGPDGLLSKADEALYSAKHRGKGQWAIWSEGGATAS